MSPIEVLAVALAGGVGAGLRWIIDAALRPSRGFPWPILLVNVTGCYVMALLATVFAGVASPVLTVATAGLLGGYTTFSTVSVDTVELWLARRRAAAVGNGVGTLLLCTLGAALGLVTATAFLP
ncbi:CrcB family protein [Microbacterium sp. Marseille-Q6965]|uniref:fluoride efflux transporter FluC n=1 Tax=Microbacterium sp. Marseille-Q6965 TaxID=2965072 RepID=UPI0021B70897|nr:CrcB family protein [Microbacterium sp. Marseille-Q6965]